MTKNELKEIVREVLIEANPHPVGWEADEDVMTAYGKPIGGTIGRRGRHEPDRWWHSFCTEAAKRIADRLDKARWTSK